MGTPNANEVMTLLPAGVDFGAEGGLVLVDKQEVVDYFRVPTRKLAIHRAETDDDYAAVVRRQEAGKPRKADGKRASKRQRWILPPKRMVVYDTDRLVTRLKATQKLSQERGYDGIFVLIESPQMLVGRSSVKTYFASGRCQNAWFNSLHKTGIPFAEIAPTSWKNMLGLDRDKDFSREMASEYFDLPEEVAESHDLCEAALIALYLRQYTRRYLYGHR